MTLKQAIARFREIENDPLLRERAYAHREKIQAAEIARRLLGHKELMCSSCGVKQAIQLDAETPKYCHLCWLYMRAKRKATE